MRFALFFVLFCFPFFVSAQTSPLWGDLKPGKFAVGYRSMHEYDRSRVFVAQRNYDGELFAGERSRPLQIQIFYPAQTATNAARMLYGDYLNFKSDTPVSEIVAEGFRRKTDGIHNWYQRRFLHAYGKGLYERLIKIPTAAIRNAPVAKGRFPLIIYGGGANFGTDENVVLWEYLASHGYIVAAVPTMGADTVDYSADDAGLEILTRDMEFLFAQVRNLPNVDADRVAAMGFSYGGQAALLMAMRNPDIKAVVGLDPSFIGTFYSKFLKNSPFYNVDNVMIPLLEMHRKDPQTVTYDLTDALKYAERYSFEINDLSHVDFTNFALLYSAVLSEQARQNPPISARKAAFEAMSRYILDFFDVHLKGGGEDKREKLKTPEKWKGYPPDYVSFRYLKARSAPPSYAEFLRIIRETGIKRGVQIYREILRRDPAASVISEKSINNLGYELLSSGKIDEAVRMLKLNVEKYPRSANAYDSLADAYKEKGDQPCAASAYRKLLEVLPLDASLDEPGKVSLRRKATEQLNTLKDVPEVENCQIKNP